jgi:hypothetical protein
MSVSNPLVSVTRPAGADLTTRQFFAVKVGSDGRVVLAAAGEMALGILQNNPAVNVAATIAMAGTSKAVAGGVINAGDPVAADANGRIVAAVRGRTNTSDAGVAADPLIGSHVIGMALEGAVLNDVFQIAIMHMGALPTTSA